MPQAPQTSVWGLEQLLTTQRLNRDFNVWPGFGRFAKKQELEAYAQFFQHAVLRQLAQVVVPPILMRRRVTGLWGQRDHE
ncbi:hypothetical protein D3C77_756080 [compost metagenome]